jgi:hypothetical protein
MAAKLSKKWKEKAKLYRRFADENKELDWSDEAAAEMYLYESYGIVPTWTGDWHYYDRRINGLYNGYFVGKHWLDVSIAMWKEDLRDKLLFIEELEPEYQRLVLNGQPISEEEIERIGERRGKDFVNQRFKDKRPISLVESGDTVEVS